MVYSTRRFVLVLSSVILFLCVFSPLSIGLTSLGEERANLSGSICACLVLSDYISSWCLGRAAACDCGTPWTFLLPFFFTSLLSQLR